MRPLLLALITGALLALSLPPFDYEWVGWWAVAPLLVAAHERRVLEGVGLGMLAGLTCGGVHVGWHPNAHGLLFAYLPFLWLAILLGVVAAGAGSARRWGGGTRWVLQVACLGVAAEWLTTFSPLPLNLALCQHRALSVIQIAAVTGVWGVSLLLWATNAALADATLARRLWSPAIGWTAAGLALSVGYGGWALSSRPAPDAPTLRVAAIQDFSAGETEAFRTAGSSQEQEVDREELTRQAAARGARLVVWTEGCLGMAFTPEARFNPTADLARELQVTLVVGHSEPGQPKPFNAASIVAPDGSVKGTHRKIHLFLGERQSVQPGQAARAFTTDLGRLGVEICFDTCYTGVTRRIARDGAQLIAMPNYDPPTPRGILHRLHAALLPFRAVENHAPFVRADPNGLSQIIDATGRILAQSPLFAGDALVADVLLGDGKGTPFARWGDWLAYLCLSTIAVSLGARLRRSALPGGDATERAEPTQSGHG